MQNRVTFATRLGAIAATVGSSVGLGNIWRFPYEAGQNGGGAFLIVYLLCILLLGLPVMIGEFVIGNASKSNAVTAFQKLTPTKPYWKAVGYLGVIASIFVLGFYSVVAGWTFEYVYQSIASIFATTQEINYNLSFTAFTASTGRPLMWIILFWLLNYFIVSRGIKKGIEQVSNWLMPIFFIILLVFCIRSLFLPAAATGLSFLFYPDFSKITPHVFLSALGQSFFSLSIGMCVLSTYASYFSPNTNLPRTAFYVAALDTLVAILAGILIFPAVFSYGINPSQGPELVFVTLPQIFSQMTGGYFWSLLFFLLLIMAALSSTISLCEVVTTFLHEKFGVSRKKAALLVMVSGFTLSTLCSLSFGVLNHITLAGFTFFNLFDFVASNICMPIGGLFISIYVGWVLDKKLVKDTLTNNGTLRFRLFPFVIFALKYIAPIAILFIFLSGLKLI